MSLRSLFMLDPEVVFLNHGSFGACPRPVFAQYQEWQRRLESQPVDFMIRRLPSLLDQARERLAAYLNADPVDLAFVPNASTGLNAIARSLPLRPGDEILTTDCEYGAMEIMWSHICRKTGARLVRQPLPLPFTSEAAVVDALWQGVTPRTRVIFVSHIVSALALTLPVAAICRRAREAGILSVVDGAHAPGQIPLDLPAVGADFYSGNCHKWLCAPKGAGFFHVRHEHQDVIEPPIFSWGSDEAAPISRRSLWQGTRDYAAYLSIPDAIDFQARHNWEQVRAQCHHLASETRQRLCDLFGCAPLSPDSDIWYRQMAAVPLPPDERAEALNERLYTEHRVEVPVTHRHDRRYLRVTFQGYNTRQDADTLIDALGEIYSG